MSRYDEPTQRVRRPDAMPAPLPGSLDPLRGHERETGTGWVEPPEDVASPATEPNATGVLPLDQLFDRPAAEAAVAPDTSTAAAEAPTWTAMPVVPVRSEPLAPPPPAYDGAAYGDSPEQRDGDGATAALSGTWQRLDAWLRRDDNGLMLVTAFVACVLMVIVASVGP